MPLLEVEAVETGYGATQVLRGLSIRLGEEERIGLFGPNGHGKTTLLKTISGLLPAWKGSIPSTAPWRIPTWRAPSWNSASRRCSSTM